MTLSKRAIEENHYWTDPIENQSLSIYKAVRLSLDQCTLAKVMTRVDQAKDIIIMMNFKIEKTI